MKILEKVERRLGEKLLLKGDRCAGPKCAEVRRAYPPGIHGKKRRRGSSEFGTLLRAKQKIRYLYGLDEREIERYTKEASTRIGTFDLLFLRMIGSRLDNAVFRLGFASSRRMARHAVGYGHITVNGRRVTIPSYRVRRGEVIAIAERSRNLPPFAELDSRLKRHEPPKWLERNTEKRTGTVMGAPEGEAELIEEVTKIKEFYSR